jgi:predicted phage-related endonuclease
MRLSLVDVGRDDELIATITQQAEMFAAQVDSGEHRLDDFTLPQVAALFPEPAGEIELDSSVLALLIEWNALKDQAKEVESREKQIKDAIANMMREAEYGIINGERVVSFKRQTQSRIDSAKLKRLVDESILAQATSTSSFRVMRGMI